MNTLNFRRMELKYTNFKLKIALFFVFSLYFFKKRQILVKKCKSQSLLISYLQCLKE